MTGLERVLLLAIGIGEIALILVVTCPSSGCSYAERLQRVHPDVSHNWICRWIQIGVLLAICAMLTSCGAPAPSLAQGGGLPTLRRLDWGFPYVDSAVWSPDGHWIAVLAGADSAVNHLEVVSPDGRPRYDLSGWHCGSIVDFAIAWLPDGRLSCLTSNGYLKIGAFPFSSFQSVPVSRPISPQPGSAWTSDGKFLIFSSISDPFVTGPYIMVTPARLYAVSTDGQVLAVESTPELYAGGTEPNWLQLSPSGTELTVVEARTPPSIQDSRTVLIAAALHEERGQLALGQQDLLAT